MMPLVNVAKNAGNLVLKKSPTILTVAAIGGLVGTVILAVKATPEAHRKVEDWYWSDEDVVMVRRKTEIIKLVWKDYMPAASLGVATVICIISSNAINSKRNAALLGAYALVENSFREFKDKVVEEIGEKGVAKVYDGIAKDRIEAKPPTDDNTLQIGTGQQLFLETVSGRYFLSDMESVRHAENDINAECINNMYATLNDFYNKLGLPVTALGDDVGWSTDRLLHIVYSAAPTPDGGTCMALNYAVQPSATFGDPWR